MSDSSLGRSSTASPVMSRAHDTSLSTSSDRITAIETELSSIPDLDRVKKSSYWAGKVIRNATKNNLKIIFKRDFQWKRKLVEHAFNGMDSEGKRLGVYLDYVDVDVDVDVDGQWLFEVRGLVETTVKVLPLSDDELIESF